jgi:hypothetical protein
MRMRSVIALTVGVTAVLAIGLATSTGGQSAGAQDPFRPDLSNFNLETVRGFQGFPLYSLGTQFEGLPLTAIVRVNREVTRKARGGFGVPDNRTNHVTFVYGTCGGGCVPPLQVQIWPACDNTLADLYFNVAGGGPSRPYELVTIRGVPAAKFSDMLQIYTGTVTIVIFGETTEQQERAAASLASANTLAGNIPPSRPLLPPVAGAMEGKLHC